MKVRLEFGPTIAHIVGSLPEKVISALKQAMSYFQDGYQFTPAYRKGRWDGRVYLFKPGASSHSFPTGLASQALSILSIHNIQYTIQDNRDRPSHLDLPGLTWTGHEPRYYQDAAVDRAMTASRGIWHVGTGGGKMLMAGLLFYRLRVRAIVLVNSKEAVIDTADELRKSLKGCTIGTWFSGKKANKSIGDITVVTIQSLYTRNRKVIDDSTGKIRTVKQPPNPEIYEHYLSCDLVIVDEVHHGGSEQWYSLLQKSGAYYKIGQTGTVARQDGKIILLTAGTGRVLYSKPTVELQEEGFLSSSEIRFYRTQPPKGVTAKEMAKMNSSDRYAHGIIHNDRRNKLIVDIVKAHPERTVLVVTKRVAHAEILAEMLGFPLVRGGMDDVERFRIKDDLTAGKLHGIVATTVYDESVNVPNLNMVVNATGASAQNAQVQRLGRAVRKDGDIEALFVDFMDDWLPSLAKHSRNRLAVMRKEGHEPVVLDFEPNAPEIEEGNEGSSLLEVL